MEFLVARGGSNYCDTHTHTYIAIFISKMALNAANEKQLNVNDSQNTLDAPPPKKIYKKRMCYRWHQYMSLFVGNLLRTLSRYKSNVP